MRLVQLWLAGVLADTVGVLLALLWTAGFLPTFLEPQAVTVLLAKPAPRWSILLGKYLGVVLFVGLHAVLFVAGTWWAIGISTGVWEAAYWFAVPLLVVNFAIFYAFSAFLAVCTRSTVVAVFGTLLFWVLCWAMNMTHHHVVGFDVQGLTPVSSFLVEAGYWILPKPLDMSGLFFDTMHAHDYSAPVAELEAMKAKGQLLHRVVGPLLTGVRRLPFWPSRPASSARPITDPSSSEPSADRPFWRTRMAAIAFAHRRSRRDRSP